jgi:hypothetical protein
LEAKIKAPGMLEGRISICAKQIGMDTFVNNYYSLEQLNYDEGLRIKSIDEHPD